MMYNDLHQYKRYSKYDKVSSTYYLNHNNQLDKLKHTYQDWDVDQDINSHYIDNIEYLKDNLNNLKDRIGKY